MNWNDPRLRPGALPQVPERVPADAFDNLVRAWGVGFCCEWFGHTYDSEFTEDTYDALKQRGEPVTKLGKEDV